MSSSPMISLKNVRKSFGDRCVLNDVSLDVEAGKTHVIIGASGTGKSVLIKSILGLIPKDSGRITIMDTDVDTLSKKDRRAMMRTCGMLFQGGALFDSLPVWHNVAFSLIHGTSTQGEKLSKANARKIAEETLHAVDLKPDVMDRFPSELSGGMQKRVALARAIAGQPDILFFDEPTTGLDPITSSTINHLIVENVKKRGITAVVITHDMGSVRVIADTVSLLHDGQIMWSGSVEDMDTTDHPHVVQFIHGHRDGPIQPFGADSK